MSFIVAVIVGILFLIGLGFLTFGGLYSLETAIFILILGAIIGFLVILGVTPALHTPLMSVTNAISGIIVVGCMLNLASPYWSTDYSIISMFAAFFASINIFGGFYVTHRMLDMFAIKKLEAEGKKPKVGEKKRS